MTNKDAIEYLQDSYSLLGNESARYHDAVIDKAIASLEAWDKVRKEIEQECIGDYTYDKVAKLHCIDIIDKHLKEVET